MAVYRVLNSENHNFVGWQEFDLRYPPQFGDSVQIALWPKECTAGIDLTTPIADQVSIPQIILHWKILRSAEKEVLLIQPKDISAWLAAR